MRKRNEGLWAIRPEASLTVLRLMSREMNASATQPSLGTGKVVLAGVQWEASAPSVQGRGPNKTAFIPVQGVLTSDGPAYYGSSYASISDAAEKALRDPDVQRIILAVDSPGGEVCGLPETGALLATIAKQKPIHAIVEGASASAAYWLTSQASDITLTPSGEVGSVGVRMMHIDVSEMLKAEGYRITEMHSGTFKTEWSPYKPLSEDAQTDMQARLDDAHRKFLGAISQGRGNRATSAIRQSRFGEGRMFSAEDALKNGMVDKLQSPRDFYRAITPAQPSQASFGISPRRARLEIERLKV